MSQEKGSIGFLTSSKELTDAFAKIQKELSGKKADWQSLNQTLTMVLETASKTISPEKMNIDIMIAVMTLTYVAKLGIEITETHERLARVEKAVRELRLK